jgi:uncharacterized protein (TIGR02284 family)
MTKTIDKLNSFLRGEISAIETYKIALQKFEKATFVSALRDNLASHEERVSSLHAEIVKHGGEPAAGSGAWGSFAKAISSGAAVFGEKAAIAALEEGEDHGRNDYQRELEDIEPPTREFVQGLLAEQLKTHAVLSTLKKQLGGDHSPRHPNA